MISEIATTIEGSLSNLSENKSVLIPKAGILNKIDSILHSTLDKTMTIKQFRKYLDTKSSELASNSPLKFQLMNLSKFLECWEFYQESSIRYAIKMDGTARLVVKTLDPSVLSEPIFEKVHSAILMSGTLYPPEMYSDLLGLSEASTNVARYSSPFPPENRWVAVDNSITTVYQQRDMDMYNKIAGQLHHMLTVIPGNSAVFFTSYDMLNNTKKLLDQHPLDKKVLVEARNLTSAGKSSIFDELKTNSSSSSGAVLLAVMGGSMAEGIDYPGSMLNGVIVVGLPLAPPSLEQNGLRSYYSQKFGAGKADEYSSVLPAMNKVFQAAGRSIRSSTDKSIIIFMDSRFNYNKYRRFFTEDYKFQDLKELENRCKNFFK
jgi:DNA excision repair protein ERCC-2